MYRNVRQLQIGDPQHVFGHFPEQANVPLPLHNITNVPLPPYNITNVPLPPYNMTKVPLPPYNITNVPLPPYNITNVPLPPYNITNVPLPPYNITNVPLPPYNITNVPLPLYNITNRPNPSTVHTCMYVCMYGESLYVNGLQCTYTKGHGPSLYPPPHLPYLTGVRDAYGARQEQPS